VRWRYTPWFDVEGLAIPSWAEDLGAWHALHDRVRAGAPKTREGFVHRDYHPGNVLWEGGTVSGVVDWVNACIGPLEVDVAHCRPNLAVTHGIEAADAFDSAYRRRTGTPPADPYWDAAALAGSSDGFEGMLAFRAFGLALTEELITARLNAFARAAARRL